MKYDGYSQQKITDFLAVPLILLSAVSCLMSLLKLPLPDVSTAAVCLFACTVYFVKQRFGMAKMLAASFAFSLLCFAAYAVHSALLPVIASFLKERFVLFGSVAGTEKMLFGNELTNLMYHTDYSGAVLTSGGIVTGAADIFAVNPSVPSASATLWLSGAYFCTLFLPVGLTAAVWKNAGSKARWLLIFTAAVSAVCGNTDFFLIALLLTCPLALPLYSVVSALSFWCSAKMDFRIGFTAAPSLPELVRYIKSPLLFVLTGIMLAAVQYFAVAWLRQRVKFKPEEKPNEST